MVKTWALENFSSVRIAEVACFHNLQEGRRTTYCEARLPEALGTEGKSDSLVIRTE